MKKTAKNGLKNESSKRTPGKQMVEIDREVLRPWRDVAWILGISTSKYLEQFLDGNCFFLLEEIADRAYRTRAKAERVAERLQTFTVNAQLSGDADMGTVDANVVETEDGRWRVKVDYLGPGERARWRRISLFEEAKEDDASDGWKQC